MPKGPELEGANTSGHQGVSVDAIASRGRNIHLSDHKVIRLNFKNPSQYVLRRTSLQAAGNEGSSLCSANHIEA